METISIRGILVNRGNVEKAKKGEFYSRTIIVKHIETWSNGTVKEKFFPIEFSSKVMGAVDDLREGFDITVKVNLNGNKWITPEGAMKAFISLRASGFDDAIEIHGRNNTEGTVDPVVKVNAGEQIGADLNNSNEDLPF